MNMANDLLAVACQQEREQIDEKLCFVVFAQAPKPVNKPRISGPSKPSASKIPKQSLGLLQRRILDLLQTGDHLAVQRIELHSRLQARPDFGHQTLAELKGNTALVLLQFHTPL